MARNGVRASDDGAEHRGTYLDREQIITTCSPKVAAGTLLEDRHEISTIPG
jgi:hypothetical protein